jgi:hypothetical protein
MTKSAEEEQRLLELCFPDHEIVLLCDGLRRPADILRLPACDREVRP